jgi:hypothetical protein
MLFKSRIKFFVFPLALAFLLVGSAEGFVHHHHEQTEDRDCAYCGFHQATSQSDFSFPAMVVIPLFSVFFSVVSLYVSYPSPGFTLASGRSPPAAFRR